MTLGELLPVGLGMLTRTPRTRHRAIDEVDRQKALRVGADLRIKALVVQLDDQEAAHAETIARIDARHAETVRLLEQQIADLERRLAIACQATAAADQTQEIDPKVIARICGQPVPLHLSPMANPAHVPAWAVQP
ncbi:hypothetical protein OG342_07175 [Streptomyces bobili]|uniref:hypothetical protein n=1 Tax=Streptomyces bobili TaxID=67280 RepID=UPI00225424CD|nr:hypothetical protein [Streptomyces bobili]MCX5522646.1 hypothetical protein [Streptomyces bobili]